MAWRELYLFESRFVSLGPHRLHYIDEGVGEPLLLVHGNPTWSFYWRNLILGLRDRYRCIAVDHIGCGLSDKPQDYNYTLQQRIDDLVQVVEQLELSGATLLAHDWGGAIGLGTVQRLKERFGRIVLFNTGAFPPPFVPWRIAICRTPLLGTLAVRGRNAFARAALTMAVEKPERMTPDVRAGLLAPYDNWANRVAVDRFVRDIPFTRRHPTWEVLERIEAGLDSLAGRPIQLIWGMRDWCFRPECLERFIRHWPQAEVQRLEDCGHYVVEDAHERIVPLVRKFFARHPIDPTSTLAEHDPMNEAARKPLSISQCATLACLLEATAPKVGNVHRGADFDGLTFADFAISAVAIGPAMEAAANTGVGLAVRDAVEATRSHVATNTNLGMALLFAPLAAVARAERLMISSVGGILRRLTPDDCRLVYEAIRLARPGGLGRVDSMDVAVEAPEDLVLAMRAAADRDLVARQYAEDFRLVLDEALPALVSGCERGWSLTEAIIHTHLSLIARHGDSLIFRKCGTELANKASAIAKQVLASGEPGDESYYEALADFDFWLRSDGNRRNPGTTADLIAAALFAGLRDGVLLPPWR